MNRLEYQRDIDIEVEKRDDEKELTTIFFSISSLFFIPSMKGDIEILKNELPILIFDNPITFQYLAEKKCTSKNETP